MSLLVSKLRDAKKRVTLPNEETLEAFLSSIFKNYNFINEQQIQMGFALCYDTLESLFFNSQLIKII